MDEVPTKAGLDVGVDLRELRRSNRRVPMMMSKCERFDGMERLSSRLTGMRDRFCCVSFPRGGWWLAPAIGFVDAMTHLP